MNDPDANPLIVAIKSFYGPLVRQTSKWPPVLAYGLPGTVAILLIIILRASVPDNLLLVATIIIITPLLGYIVSNWDERRQKLRHRTAITGNVLFTDGLPVKGANVFIEGIDRLKQTDETGWFQIEVNPQEEFTVRATYNDEVTAVNVKIEDIQRPVRLSIKKKSSRH